MIGYRQHSVSVGFSRNVIVTKNKGWLYLLWFFYKFLHLGLNALVFSAWMACQRKWEKYKSQRFLRTRSETGIVIAKISQFNTLQIFFDNEALNRVYQGFRLNLVISREIVIFVSLFRPQVSPIIEAAWSLP